MAAARSRQQRLSFPSPSRTAWWRVTWSWLTELTEKGGDFMKYRIWIALWPMYIAGAAQLGQVTTSSAAGVTRASIPVLGKFTFNQNRLTDRVYFDLVDVRPAVSSTQQISVNDPLVSVI